MINSYFNQYSKALLLRLYSLFVALYGILCIPLAHAQFLPDKTDAETFHHQASDAMQRGNYAIAYCIWQPMAQKGDNRAQYNLGWMYHNGYGLRIDDEMAFYWWLKAAATGSADAHFALGDLYANGQGVEKNLAIALGWYISAALKNHESARETLLSQLASNDKLAQRTFKSLLQSSWNILGDTMEVSVDKANTRAGPDKSYKIITTLERGHPVIPLKKQKGWTYVGITGLGKNAWIFSRLISKPAGIYPLD